MLRFIAFDSHNFWIPSRHHTCQHHTGITYLYPKWCSFDYSLCFINIFQQKSGCFGCGKGSLADCSSQDAETQGKQTNRCTSPVQAPPSLQPPCSPPCPIIIKFWICIHLAFMVFSSSTIWAQFMCCYITDRIFFHGKDLTEWLPTDHSDYFINTLF